jgi:cytidylate kinase
MKDNIVTIDGPSASGKGTFARNIAKHLGFEILDSGLLYRVYAYLFNCGIGHSQDSRNHKPSYSLSSLTIPE